MDVIWIDGEVSELPWNETRLRHTAETEQRNGVQRGGGVAHILACHRRRLPTSHYLTDSETRDRFPLSLFYIGHADPKKCLIRGSTVTNYRIETTASIVHQL